LSIITGKETMLEAEDTDAEVRSGLPAMPTLQAVKVAGEEPSKTPYMLRSNYGCVFFRFVVCSTKSFFGDIFTLHEPSHKKRSGHARTLSIFTFGFAVAIVKSFISSYRRHQPALSGSIVGTNENRNSN
jgi:hypothetical protein